MLLIRVSGSLSAVLFYLLTLEIDTTKLDNWSLGNDLAGSLVILDALG